MSPMAWKPFGKKRDDLQVPMGDQARPRGPGGPGRAAGTRRPLPRVPLPATWQEADALYRAGRAALREAETVEDVLTLQDSLVRAFFHLSRSDALAAGEDPPSRCSDPCFPIASTAPPWPRSPGPPTGPAWSPPLCAGTTPPVGSGLAPRFRDISPGWGHGRLPRDARRRRPVGVEQRKEMNLAVNGGYAQVYAQLSVLDNIRLRRRPLTHSQPSCDLTVPAADLRSRHGSSRPAGGPPAGAGAVPPGDPARPRRPQRARPAARRQPGVDGRRRVDGVEARGRGPLRLRPGRTAGRRLGRP